MSATMSGQVGLRPGPGARRSSGQSRVEPGTTSPVRGSATHSWLVVSEKHDPPGQ